MHTAKNFRDTFTYADGQLLWKKTRRKAVAGAVAGGMDVKGYLRVTLDKKVYLVHRVVYKMLRGRTPRMLDHIDNDPLNNRIENLRPCTPSQNAQNRKRPVNNTSGVKGVYWNRAKNKWMARVMTGGARTFIGYFSSLDAAAEAVQTARSKQHQLFARSI